MWGPAGRWQGWPQMLVGWQLSRASNQSWRAWSKLAGGEAPRGGWPRGGVNAQPSGTHVLEDQNPGEEDVVIVPIALGQVPAQAVSRQAGSGRLLRSAACLSHKRKSREERPLWQIPPAQAPLA